MLFSPLIKISFLLIVVITGFQKEAFYISSRVENKPVDKIVDFFN